MHEITQDENTEKVKKKKKRAQDHYTQELAEEVTEKELMNGLRMNNGNVWHVGQLPG